MRTLGMIWRLEFQRILFSEKHSLESYFELLSTMSNYFENPSAILDMSSVRDKGQSALHSSIEQIARKICGGNWANDASKVTMTPITGGISNVLYLVTLNESGNIREEKVVVRLFGLGTEKFTDRSVENIIFAELSKKNQSPKLLGLFNDGRVEGYLDSRPLEPDEFTDEAIYPKLARAAADIHTLPLHLKIDQMNNRFCWHKISVFFSLAKQVGENSFGENPEKAAKFEALDIPKMEVLFQKFESFVLEKAKESRQNFINLRGTFDNYSLASTNGVGIDDQENAAEGIRGEKRKSFVGDEKYREELMKAIGSELAYQSVFCHNDLLSGNFLYQLNRTTSAPERGPGDITIIDYEYGGYNFRAFDIANHFNEYAGFDFSKIPSKFPNKDVRYSFIREYLSYLLSLENFHDVDGTLIPKDVHKRLSDFYNIDFIASTEEQKLIIESFDQVVQIFTLLSHLLWGSWSVCQAGMSSIDFDFLEYARLRFEFFYYHKDLFKINF